MTRATEKRLRTLEIMFTGLRRNSRRSPLTKQSTTALLDKLMDQAWWLEEVAEAAGELRLAVACLQAISQFAEFKARLAGELDDRSRTNVSNVDPDPAVARRIAETYLKRHKMEGAQNECS